MSEVVEQPPNESNDEEQSAPARVPEDNTPIVLVTGASGYIASHIIKILLEEGKYRVRGTVRDATNESKTKLIRDLAPNAAKPIELVSADLTSEGSWEEAVKGCTYVLHLASPVSIEKPTDEDEVIRPAVEGTLNVLKACAAEVKNGLLKRVVLMSSIVAVTHGLGDKSSKIHTEEDGSDDSENHDVLLTTYEKSKRRAERAAWDFMEKLETHKKFELSVICPAVTIGPILNKANGTTVSMKIILGLFDPKIFGLVNVNWPIVDVRDVAKGTIAAMEKPVAANRRYLLANENPIPHKEIASIIAEEFTLQGYKIPNKPINRAIFWFASLFNSDVKNIRNWEGAFLKFNISRMTGELGISPYPFKTSILDASYSLIDHGVIAKVPKYLGHPDTRSLIEHKAQKDTELTEEPKAEEMTTEEPKVEAVDTEEIQAEETATEEPKGD